LCCCACGLSASSGTCTATSTGLTLPPYTQCTTSSANVWEITLLRAWCPILHNCNGLSAVYNHIAASVDEDAIWYFTTCTNDNCTRTSSSSSSYYAPNKPARCWQ
jgi:hypothetical protein